jgi:hypothetical protein
MHDDADYDRTIDKKARRLADNSTSRGIRK